MDTYLLYDYNRNILYQCINNNQLIYTKISNKETLTIIGLFFKFQARLYKTNIKPTFAEI